MGEPSGRSSSQALVTGTGWGGAPLDQQGLRCPTPVTTIRQRAGFLTHTRRQPQQKSGGSSRDLKPQPGTKGGAEGGQGADLGQVTGRGRRWGGYREKRGRKRELDRGG